MPNLYLIGYRGCGKTTVARLLSQLLNMRAVDADEYLEQQAGMTIREIFAAEGEAGFRQREADVVEALTRQDALIVSWGGGVILRDTNREALQQAGQIVWLRARPETLLERIERDPTTGARRPNLTAAGGLPEIQNLLTIREPIYAAVADRIVAADDAEPRVLAADIAAWYQKSPARSKGKAAETRQEEGNL